MSQRSEAYKKSLERLERFLEHFFSENTVPTASQIKTEIKALEGLKEMTVEVLPYDPPVKEGEDFFYMVFEEFSRYDSLLPEAVYICIVPAEVDDPKSINQLVSQKPILW